jgi:hypothetical protein
MKTHTSRWTRTGAAWLLHARGGDELARVRHAGTLLYEWQAGTVTGTAESLYAAQRAVRRALKGT